MLSDNCYAVIMAGGAGTRLWPLSSRDKPKHFLKLFGGKSLIELTVDKLRGQLPEDRILILTSVKYRGGRPVDAAADTPGELRLRTLPARHGQCHWTCGDRAEDKVPGGNHDRVDGGSDHRARRPIQCGHRQCSGLPGVAPRSVGGLRSASRLSQHAGWLAEIG